jgi:glycosyltransferase involved in cell wall biosynthesis
MNNQLFCSIVIPALNESEYIEQCLKSLNNQSYPRDRYEIIIVDNGSTDNTVEIAKKYADAVFVKNDGNVGAVRNYGAKKSSGEILICTDADCLVNYDWISTGTQLLVDHPNYAFGGGLKPRECPTWIERYWLLNDNGMAIQQHDLMGSCIFCWKSDFFKTGSFNEHVTSGEDSDLSSKFKANGINVELKGKLSLVHLGSPQSASHFVKRQIWHSENYLRNIHSSLTDKMFWITLSYLSTAILCLLTLANSSFLILLLINQTFPTLLTIKRISRSKQRIKNPLALIKATLLDNLYLIGRSIGLLKGLIPFKK